MAASLNIARAMIAVMPLAAASASSAPLESWNDTSSKRAIVEFVSRVTRDDSPDYVEPAKRIAVFDNDGTLWAEQPMYFQLAFALDRVKTLSAQHPEWKSTPPFKDVLSGDTRALAASGEHGMLQIVAASHAGVTTEEFNAIVAAWLATANHPKFLRPYTQLAYRPMLEVLDYLRDNGFKPFIVSGGGVEFMRVFAEQVYGIPPEQIIGSSGATSFLPAGKDGQPALLKEARVEFIDDGPGKPSGINRFIGRRPIFAFGNSDGDQQMLQWTAAGGGARFIGLIHHTDAAREYAYDRQSSFGRLDKALDEATARGWTVVNMKTDWRRVFQGDSP